ncbi:nitrate- and nitrite sensing domain-containing protein [Methyloversatilis discipulorum]|uniref:nitrate- and nitrite sensing domain-containing protein n=1 Tax=Methyloversatilis discipulorum TaxID=1119528 RepID=UPI0026EE7F76|nr:nitrate- and nitrite sensing domain-containing protein [Methyloversatilis discipulorum]
MLSLPGVMVLLALAIALALVFMRPEPGGDSSPGDNAQRAFGDCERLLQLVHSLQQHRGMSMAWLAGDALFESPMRARRRAVQHDIDALEVTARAEMALDGPCVTPYELALLDAQWKELCGALDCSPPAIGAEDNLTRHSLLVSHVLGWLAAVGNRRIAPFAASGSGLLRTWISTLPALGEQLGQARAVGSAAAARGVCTAAERMRLMYLASRAESLMHQAIADTPRLPGALPATERVVRLLGLLRSDLLGATDRMTAELYFAEATAAIDAIYAWMSSCEEALRGALAQQAVSAG